MQTHLTKEIRATRTNKNATAGQWFLVLGILISVGFTTSACHGNKSQKAFSDPPVNQSSEFSSSLWRATLETRQLGPLECYLRISLSGNRLSGYSKSGSVEAIRNLPNSKADHLGTHLLAFEATRSQSDATVFQGRITSPWTEEGFELKLEEDHLSGKINHWLIGGTFTANKTSRMEEIRDAEPILKSLDQVVPHRIFQPKMLTHPGYLSFRESFAAISENANDDLDLVLGFHFAWQNVPFSHFQLRRSRVSAEALFASFDQMEVGYQAAQVHFDQDIAILRVDTMMGNDTIEQIKSAYQEIAERSPKSLIIDLRGNGGGAFAVKPLVEHIIDEPFEAGFFLSQPWNSEHERLPSPAELARIPSWEGWSVSSFWRSVQAQGIMKLEFRPSKPHFGGPVYVLVDQFSASATELAADAFRVSGQATLIGEQTAGEMLSQSFFDLVDGFMISLPVADYYSIENGRIEGVGIPVDRSAASAEALEFAKSLARQTTSNP